MLANANILYAFLEVQTLNCFLVYSFSAFSTSELEFVKPNVSFSHGQDEDLPEVINEVSSPSSSSFSPSPQRQTRARTAHEKSPSKELKEVRQKEKEEQESLLSLKVESVESENEEEREDPFRQFTIDKPCSLPENFHFIIDESSSEDEKVEPVDDGLLPVVYSLIG
jgi:hypothetical protein